MLPSADAGLLQIVDAALLDAARRAGSWLACRPGCNQCCTGVFSISQLDAERLRHGLQQLLDAHPAAAQAVITRVRRSREALALGFPGDVESGLLRDDDASQEAFDSYADDAVCPVLDPVSGTCALYEHRPMTCRTFGPPVATEDGGLGTCELCFQGASDDIVQQAQVYLPSPELEDSIAAELPVPGQTIVAFAFNT